MDEKYISVTKFKETLAKLTVEGGTEATRTTIARTLGEVVPKLLDDEPFADVQTVIHSRWIPTGDGTYNAYCENCGQERGSKSWNKNDFKYCFGCGARMDGDTSE